MPCQLGENSTAGRGETNVVKRSCPTHPSRRIRRGSRRTGRASQPAASSARSCLAGANACCTPAAAARPPSSPSPTGVVGVAAPRARSAVPVSRQPSGRRPGDARFTSVARTPPRSLYDVTTSSGIPRVVRLKRGRPAILSPGMFSLGSKRDVTHPTEPAPRYVWIFNFPLAPFRSRHLPSSSVGNSRLPRGSSRLQGERSTLRCTKSLKSW